MTERQYRVMIIDDQIGEPRNGDNMFFRETYSFDNVEYLLHSGMNDKGEFSVDAAAAFVKANQDADAILLDWMFGSRSEFGGEILAKIAEQGNKVPIAVISSIGGEPEVRELCESYGVVTYLKPKDHIPSQDFYSGLMKIINEKEEK